MSEFQDTEHILRTALVIVMARVVRVGPNKHADGLLVLAAL